MDEPVPPDALTPVPSGIPLVVPSGGMWHVTVTVAGEPVTPDRIRNALEHLSEERPFLLAGRYAPDRAEVRYWEEASSAADAVDVAMGLWEEHRESAGLPVWSIVGVEVIDQETFHRRGRSSVEHPALVAPGRVVPF